MELPVATSPARRFVQLRHADPIPGSATTTFMSAPAGARPDPATHGVLADLAMRDPRRAARVQDRLQFLISRNEAVMAWLEANPANSALFASDPVAALRRALPDLGPDFFDGWS
jgi:hypothetical protein